MKTLENTEMDLKRVSLAIESLAIYRNITTDKVITRLRFLINCLTRSSPDLSDVVGAYNDLCFEVFTLDRHYDLKNYIIEKIVFDRNIFSLNAEKYGFSNLDGKIKESAAADLFLLQFIAEFSPAAVKEYILKKFIITDFERYIIEKLPDWNMRNAGIDHCGQYSEHILSIINRLHSSPDWNKCVETLAGFHHTYGSGIFSRHKAFVWDHGNGSGFLRGIDHPDPVSLKDLVGYEPERSEVIDNTIQFLNGFPSNNVLLYGDRGTGKSSTVKAILNEYYAHGLRLVEIPKKYLFDFPDVIRELSSSKLKFIIFIDDLAFEDSEEIYTGLKAVLEGGIESKPMNVVIYATSNRRHLIKEKFSDRAGLQSCNTEDEIHASDTMQEKLSLSDRFGITVVFSAPDKYKFLEIVDGIVLRRGLKVDKETLHKEALKWELWYNGRSPRTARQFVDWFQGRLAQNSDEQK